VQAVIRRALVAVVFFAAGFFVGSDLGPTEATPPAAPANVIGR
jgi:hypothetical protein